MKNKIEIKEKVRSLEEIERDMSDTNTRIEQEEARLKSVTMDVVNYLRDKETIEDWNSHILTKGGIAQNRIVRTDNILVNNTELNRLRALKSELTTELFQKKKEDLFHRIKLNIGGIEKIEEITEIAGAKKWKVTI